MKTKVVILVSLGVLTSCAAVGSYSSSKGGPTYYLPQTLVQVTFTPGKAESATTDAVTATPITISNTNQRYVLRYHPSAFADDRLCVSRTTTGLLQRVYFSADDRTDDFLLNVVQLAAEGAGDPPATGEGVNIGVASRTTQLDPFDAEQIRAFNDQIAPYSISFPTLEYKPKNKKDEPPQPAFSCPEDSICFATRIVVPVNLSLNGKFVSGSSVEIIDPKGYGSFKVTRAFMASKITKVDFDNGVLTSLRVRKDSEALAASEFPLKAIERALSVPGNGIGLAFGSYEEKKALREKRKEFGTKAPESEDPKDLIELDSCTK